MNNSLYRKESYESKIKGFSNPVTIRGSLSALYMSGGLLVIVTILAVFSWLTTYTNKVSAFGFIAPKSGNVTLSSPISGILKVDVETGQKVEKGDVLATVSETLNSESDDSVEGIHIASIESRLALADRRYELLKERQIRSKRVDENRIERSRGLVESRRLVLKMQRRLLNLADISRNRINDLYKSKVATVASLEESDSRLIVATQNMIDAELLIAEAIESSADARAERDLNVNALEDEIAQHRSERLLLETDLERLSVERVRNIVAPTSGILTYSLASNFQTVNPSEPLFVIEPIDDEYDAIVLASSSAIGFASVGDVVMLHYAAYPYQDHGVFEGKIEAIDTVAQLPSAISAPISIDEPIYRVYAKVDQNPKSKGGDELRLVSGMLFEAKIIAEEKPLLYWMLSPFF